MSDTSFEGEKWIEIEMSDEPSRSSNEDSDKGVIEARHSLYAEISREMVRLYKEQFGRGPTKARTAFAGSDCLICTLEESLTPAEKKMVALGEDQRLRDVRLLFQHATESEFVEVVERLTSRQVRGFVSGMDTRMDISSEVFYLEPVAG